MPEMLIGGEWREAAAHEERLEVVNPATEEIVDSVPARLARGRRAGGGDGQARVRRVVQN